MTRLYLFAEGQTEQTFADKVLKPHLANFGVYLHGIVLIAHGRKQGRALRGGGRKYLPMKNDIQRFTKQESGPDVYFTSMIDLYAISDDFPGLADAERYRQNPPQRVVALEQAWANDIGDKRFVPYIQLHEFEALLFAQPPALELFYDQATPQIARLEAIAASYASPELINDGATTAPSKRIMAELPDYGSAKTTIGPQVAQLIGLPVLRARCPHFAKWVSRLEQLGAGAST